MKRKLIHVDSFTLACDAKGCGYEIKNAGLHSHWLGFPCPNCGANMLTESDHKAALAFKRFADWVNKWFGWLGKVEAPPNAPSVGVQMHDGKMKMTRKEKP